VKALLRRLTRRTPPPSRRDVRRSEQHAAQTQRVRSRRVLGVRGWTGRGSGHAFGVPKIPLWRGTTAQVPGLFPFAVGAGTPMIGVPLGRSLLTGATLCCDPINWFQRARLISNPSVFILGKPGLGKSTIIRRMATGLAAYGVLPMVLGDLKPDMVDVIEAMQGQVIRLGHGRSFLNILDPGEARQAAERLREAGRPDLADEVLADAHGRRRTMVAALLAISRGTSPTDREEAIIDAALRLLDAQLDRVPVLGDLLRVVQEAPRELRHVAVDRNDDARYREITEDLEASLISLTQGGRLGAMFSQATTTPIDRTRPVVFDVSGIHESEHDLRAAALMACWSDGFASVNIAQVLADAGLEPRRHRLIVLDELWQVLRSGAGMVDRVDALTRLNRTFGVGQVMASHTMSDLEALPEAADRMKARGFVERAGMVICGGLPAAEMPLLRSVMQITKAEERMLVSWTDPPAWDDQRGVETEPPGRGHFLVKVGGRSGIPFRTFLTEAERSVNDTNKRWHTSSRIGEGQEAA
jgi:hypothetical protein